MRLDAGDWTTSVLRQRVQIEPITQLTERQKELLLEFEKEEANKKQKKSTNEVKEKTNSK